MYAETSLHLNGGKKSKCMQEQAYLSWAERKVQEKITFGEQDYLWTAEIKANLCRDKFTFEQRKEK